MLPQGRARLPPPLRRKTAAPSGSQQPRPVLCHRAWTLLHTARGHRASSISSGPGGSLGARGELLSDHARPRGRGPCHCSSAACSQVWGGDVRRRGPTRAQGYSPQGRGAGHVQTVGPRTRVRPPHPGCRSYTLPGGTHHLPPAGPWSSGEVTSCICVGGTQMRPGAPGQGAGNQRAGNLGAWLGAGRPPSPPSPPSRPKSTPRQSWRAGP